MGSSASSTGWLHHIKRLDLKMLVSFFAIILLIVAFRQIANWIAAGTTERIDTQLLLLCRDDSPEHQPLGSPRFVSAVRDFTALGSGTVLTLLVLVVTAYYLLQGHWRTGLFLLFTSLIGWGLMEGIKEIYARPRPTIVTPLMVESSYSFPSGHAKMSAVIYLTLGAILAQNSKKRSIKFFWIALAVLLTLLIGSSRVYLGVHHPSDVLAGWLAGSAWALLAFLLARLLHLGFGKRSHPSASATTQP